MSGKSKQGIIITTVLMVLLGCASVFGDDQTLVFRNPPKTAFISAGISIFFLMAAFLGIRFGINRMVRWVFITIGTISGAIFTPMVFMEQVTVSPTEITQETGLVFAPLIKGFKYEEVQKVLITTGKQGRRQRTIVIWEITYRDGNVERLNPSDLWERNSEPIVRRLEELGVLFER